MPQETFASSGHGPVAKRLYERAGVGPSDIDVALIYDHFTPMVIMQLKDYGFCGKGEGGAFVESGAIRYDGGSLPVNTHGGQLSEAYIIGMTHVMEAVEQLRGDGGQPGRGCGGRARDRRPGIDSRVVADPSERGVTMSMRGVLPPDVIVSQAPVRRPNRSGRRPPSTGSCSHAARVAAPSGSCRRRSVSCAGPRAWSGSITTAPGDLLVHGDPPRRDPAGRRRVTPGGGGGGAAGHGRLPARGERRRLRSGRGADRVAGHARLVRRARGQLVPIFRL